MKKGIAIIITTLIIIILVAAIVFLYNPPQPSFGGSPSGNAGNGNRAGAPMIPYGQNGTIMHNNGSYGGYYQSGGSNAQSG